MKHTPEPLSPSPNEWMTRCQSCGLVAADDPEVWNHLNDEGCPGSSGEEGTYFPLIVCLCGSTQFVEAWCEATRRLSLDRQIVLSVGVMIHAGDEPLRDDGPEKKALDELHLRKIDLADYIYVLNVGGYIGKSTAREIEYALKVGKPIEYLETP